jgi:hypothetical protein
VIREWAGRLVHPGGCALGTNNAAPGYATVGENGVELVGKNGPEMRYFRGGETVVPNSNLRARYAPGVSGSGGGASIDYDRLAQAMSRVQIAVDTSIDGRTVFTSVRRHSIKEARDSITGKSGLA